LAGLNFDWSARPMSKSKAPFPWYGGKSSHLTWLLPIINKIPHVCYAEPFSGSAAVLLNKSQSPVEVYNDIHSDVVNFFKVLREYKEEFISSLELTPYSREDFSTACLRNDASDVEKARQFYVLARQVRDGLATTASPGRWSYGVSHSRRGMAMPVSRWLSSIDGLVDLCERLKQVQIENIDALDLIKRYDTKDTLFYVDPPYVMESRSGGKAYLHECDESFHSSLIDKLKVVRGKVVLSGYSNALYSKELKSWRTIVLPEKSSASARHSDKTSMRQEVLWMNFDNQ
jgi:DNA adenine methylase